MKKIKKGDNVIVLTGADKGKKGIVEKVITSINKVVVSGVNQKTRHSRKGGNTGGQKIEVVRPIHISNVAIVDPKGGKATRVGIKEEKGVKVRVAKKSGQIVK